MALAPGNVAVFHGKTFSCLGFADRDDTIFRGICAGRPDRGLDDNAGFGGSRPRNWRQAFSTDRNRTVTDSYDR